MSDISNLCHLSFIISISKGLLVLLIFSRNQPLVWGFPAGSDTKESACNAGDLCSITGPRRSPGEGNGYPLQYSCLENSMDREAWQATVHGVTEVDTAQQLTLSLSTFCFIDFSLLTSNFQFIDLCSNLYCFFSSAYLDLVFFLKFCEVEA